MPGERQEEMIPNSLTKNSNLIHSPCQGQGHTWQRFPGKEDSTETIVMVKKRLNLGLNSTPKKTREIYSYVGWILLSILFKDPYTYMFQPFKKLR